MAGKHSAYPLTELATFEVPTILNKFVSKEANSENAILNLSWQPGSVYTTSFHLTRHPSQGLFFQVIILFAIFNAIILEFVIMAQEQPSTQSDS